MYQSTHKDLYLTLLFNLCCCCFLSDTRVQAVYATASSAYGTSALAVIDGNVVTCHHTSGPYWDNFIQTELSEYTAVRQVVLYLRQDCCKFVFAHSAIQNNPCHAKIMDTSTWFATYFI